MDKLLVLLIEELIFILSFLSTNVESDISVVDAITQQHYLNHHYHPYPSHQYHYEDYDDNEVSNEEDGRSSISRIGKYKRFKRETIRFENDVVVIPENYSIHEPPPTKNDTPTNVDFYILIIDIRDINEVQEEMTLEMNLQIYWKDSRLSHWALPERNPKSKFGVLNPMLIKDIWHPDVFIDHVKKIDQPKVISVPASLRFYYKDSTFRYSGRFTMKFGCQMKFQHYPADTQRCVIEVKSYSYSATTLVLSWRDGKPPAIKKGLTLPNFALALGHPEQFWLNTSSSSYSGIRFAVVLRRHLGFHLIQTYLLSCLFVILSFLTFLVAHESVLECMALCMTTLLTLTAMFAAVKQNTPTVSYVKGLDIWMVTCIFSVFFTLVEHTVLLRLRTGSLSLNRTIKARSKTPRRKRSIFSISGKKKKQGTKQTTTTTTNNASSTLDPLGLYYHKCSSRCKGSSDTSGGDNSPILEIRRNNAERTLSSSLWRSDYMSSIPTLRSPSITPTLSPVRSSSFGRHTQLTSMSTVFDDLPSASSNHQHHHPHHLHSQSNGRLPNRSISGLPTIHSSETNNNDDYDDDDNNEHNFSNHHQPNNHNYNPRSNNSNNRLDYNNVRKSIITFNRLKKATNLEIYFSKLIPFSFLIFNCIYWPWLLLSADYYNDTEFLRTNYV